MDVLRRLRNSVGLTTGVRTYVQLRVFYEYSELRDPRQTSKQVPSYGKRPP